MNRHSPVSRPLTARLRRPTTRAAARLLAAAMLAWLATAATLQAQQAGRGPLAFGAPSDKSSHGKFCTGELVLDQGPGAEFGLWSESTCDGCGTPAAAQILADDFAIDRDMVITEVVIWGYHWPLNVPPPTETWTVIFHADDAGFPAATLPGGISRVTTDPAPTMHPSPIETPGRTVTR